VDPPSRIAPFRNGRYSIVMPGIGGTGVVTINAILATAATLDGLFVTSLDQTGLAQKGGAVTSHLILSPEPVESAARVTDPDLGLGFDVHGLDSGWPITVRNTALPGPLNTDANRMAEEIFGSHLMVNMFLTGFAWQAGLIPVSMTSIEKAIEWNGVEAAMNRAAFHWGRAILAGHKVPGEAVRDTKAFDPAAELTAYQDAAYARQYTAFVEGMPADIRDAAARGLFKLMAYKDEYEVARLLTKPGFEGAAYNLHPPFLRAMGLKRKIELGPWFRPALQMLAALKFLRGTPLDPFGWMKHRREERELIGWYKETLRRAIGTPYAAEIAALPQSIRGFDEIKSRSIAAARKRAEELCAGQPVSFSR
jgi:indolepyruvate ferredoxin oxidoreductase